MGYSGVGLAAASGAREVLLMGTDSCRASWVPSSALGAASAPAPQTLSILQPRSLMPSGKARLGLEVWALGQSLPGVVV